MEGSICEEVSMQDCGPFLDPFEYLNQHAWRKMAKYGFQEVSGLTKAFEDGRKLAQLTCCRLQSSGPSLERA